jgi:hypothetical protein
MPSQSYDYTIGTPLIPTADFKLHLKPGTRIQFQPQQAIKGGTPLFDLDASNTELQSLNVTVTSDIDSRTTIECIQGENPNTIWLATVGNNSELNFENVSLYGDSELAAEKLFGHLEVLDSGQLSLKGCTYISSTAISKSGNIYNFSMLGAGKIDLENCRVGVYQYQSDENAESGHFYIQADDPLSVTDIVQGVRVYNSKFMNLYRSTSASTHQYAFRFNDYALDPDNSIWAVILDDCVFVVNGTPSGSRTTFTSSTQGSEFFYTPGGGVLVVNYVSRSIQNYRGPVYDVAFTVVSEASGVAESLTPLTVAGFGFLERYTTIQYPFNFLF